MASRGRFLRLMGRLAVLLALLLAGPLWVLATERVEGGSHWASADRKPAGLAPRVEEGARTVVQIYAARTWGWRGAFGVHTWIAFRRAGAEAYRLHHVLSWCRPTLVSQSTASPDRAW